MELRPGKAPARGELITAGILAAVGLILAGFLSFFAVMKLQLQSIPVGWAYLPALLPTLAGAVCLVVFGFGLFLGKAGAALGRPMMWTGAVAALAVPPLVSIWALA